MIYYCISLEHTLVKSFKYIYIYIITIINKLCVRLVFKTNYTEHIITFKGGKVDQVIL